MQSIGKAPLADLKSGLATAPTLFACDDYPELLPYIQRKFENPGDIEAVSYLVQKSTGLQKTKDLAQVHAEHAINSIQKVYPPSRAKDALIALAVKIITRSH
jgi:geranylgeranyl pyrophosphate synthase